MGETTKPEHGAQERGPQTAAPAGVAPEPQESDVADAGQVPEPAAEDDAQRYLELAQRTQADFENYKRRASRELTEARRRGAAELARELLPAMDNLERAIEHAEQDDPLLQGVAIVRDELVAALGRAGIETYSPVGEQFDPTQHEAVATAPSADGEDASGKVVEVYQAGYRIGESVIRPARVVVGA